MAEVLGTVASAIAVVELAGKAVTVSFKLKSLWEEVKDLPVTLLEKAEELQDLDEFLRDAESNAANNPLPNSVWNGTIMQNATSRARAAMDDFQRTLDMQIDSLADKRRRRQKLAAAKIVFQKDSLDAMERKLDRALRLFRMAQNQYCVMCASVIVERLPQSLDESESDNDEADHFVGSQDYCSLDFPKLRESHLAKPYPTDAAEISQGTALFGRLRFAFSFQKSHVSVRTPRWLGSSVHSLMIQKSISGWQLNLSSHAVIVSFPQSISNAVDSDDIINLQKSLRHLNLTPYAHNQRGCSLLFYAAKYGAVEVSRWLLSIGLYTGSYGECSPSYSGKGITTLFSRTPLERLLEYRKKSEQNISRIVEILRAFTAYVPDSVEDESSIWRLAMHNRAFEQYRDIQQVMNPELLLAPFQARLWQCVSGLLGAHWTLRQVLCFLPEIRSLSISLIKSVWFKSEGLTSLSGLVAIGVGWELLESKGELLRPLAEGSYCSVIGDIARLIPMDLSVWMTGQRTPFAYMIERILARYESHSTHAFDRVLQSATRSWATMLSDNGIDLLKYGYNEKPTSFAYREGRIPFRSEARVRRYRYFRVLGITYGALPEQWKVWWSIYDFEYAGDFWHMVESSAFSIPGSWEADFDSHQEDPIWNADVPWDDDERGDCVIWSEYRRNRPPC